MKKIALLVLALGVFASVKGQSASWINNPTDVRSIGMGNSGLALPGSAYSIFSNTAALALNENTWGAGYTFSLWNPDGYKAENRHAVAGYYKFGKHSITAGVRYYMRTIEGFNENGGTIADANVFNMAGELGYAFAINEYMGVSANVRYINSMLSDSPLMKNGTAFAGDLGFYFRKNSFSAALSVANLGSKISFSESGPDYDLGSWVKAGAAYGFELGDKHLLTGSLQLGYQIMPSEGSFDGGLGAEYMYNDKISARVGYHLVAGDRGPSYGTAGLGYNFKNFSINAAYLLGGILDGTLMLGLDAKF